MALVYSTRCLAGEARGLVVIVRRENINTAEDQSVPGGKLQSTVRRGLSHMSRRLGTRPLAHDASPISPGGWIIIIPTTHAGRVDADFGALNDMFTAGIIIVKSIPSAARGATTRLSLGRKRT